MKDKDRVQMEYCDKVRDIEIDYLKGVDLSKLLFNEFYYAMDCSFAGCIKVMIQRLLYTFDGYKYQEKDSSVFLFSPIIHRQGYEEYWNTICGIVDFASSLRIDYRIRRKRTLSGIFSKCRLLFKTLKKLRGIDFLKHRLYVASRLIELDEFRLYLDHLKINPQIAICFFDGEFYSNFFVQYCKRLGSITLTNQHGQPIFRSCVEDRLNQSQIINLTADHFLAKGEFTKKQFAKAGYSEDSVIIIGSLIKGDNISINTTVSDTFGVFLDCPLLPFADVTNSGLIKTAEDLFSLASNHYVLKLHPLDSMDKYIKMDLKGCCGMYAAEKDIAEISKTIDYAIMCASSVYVDLIGFGVKTYKLNIGPYFPIVNRAEDIVNDASEIVNKNRKWMELDTQQKLETLVDRRNEYFFLDTEGTLLSENIKKLISVHDGNNQ